MAKQYLFAIPLMALSTHTFADLQSLDELEMEGTYGQAGILNIDRYDFSGNNFYRLQTNGTIQTSVNIDKLVLRDGNGNVQVDIDNITLSGGERGSFNAAGNGGLGSFDNNIVSSATITNPFIEFAFGGSLSNDDITDREFIGVRFGAEGLNGVLSFGQQAPGGDRTADTGINTFTGFLTTNDITATAQTLDSGGGTQTNINLVSGTRDNFNISGEADITTEGCNFFNAAICLPAAALPNEDFTGVVDLTFPSVTTNPFVIPGITVNATTPITSTTINANGISVPPLPFRAAGTSSLALFGILTLNLDIDSNGTITDGLVINSTVQQDLRFIHRAEVNSDASNPEEGTYLSFQNRNISWRDAPTGDVAQAGWWLSVGAPADLGDLALTDVFLPDSTLQGISDALSASSALNPVEIPGGDAISGLFGATINLNLGNVSLAGSDPIPLNLSNQSLGSEQIEVRNCWTGSLGC